MDEARRDEAEGMDRGDFFRTLALGFGGAGVATLLGGQAFAEVEKKGKYVFVITRGAGDPNRTIFALLMAQVVAKKGWGAVHVWTTLEGAELAHKDRPGGSNRRSSRSSAAPRRS